MDGLLAGKQSTNEGKARGRNEISADRSRANYGDIRIIGSGAHPLRRVDGAYS